MSGAGKQAVVLGAGVVGCAVAERLARQGYECVVLERGPRIAEGVTSRNSGVIHAGIYYPPGSLKARTCVRGQALLYEWCQNHGVPHRRVGKWIVGGMDAEAELEAIQANAVASGATGIGVVERIRLPGVKAELGFFSSSTGIVDPYELSRSLQIAAEENGASFVMEARVQNVSRLADGTFEVQSNRGELRADIVINSTGLDADEFARQDGLDGYRVYPWRGDYFRLRRPGPWQNLIYPVKKPNAPGLGIHLTLGLDGSCRLGPDVEFLGAKDQFGPPADLEGKAGKFFEAASRYLEGIRPEDLEYDTCGIRPKLRAPDEKTEKDFVIRTGSDGYVHLLGIESPGLTASLALAELVAEAIG